MEVLAPQPTRLLVLLRPSSSRARPHIAHRETTVLRVDHNDRRLARAFPAVRVVVVVGLVLCFSLSRPGRAQLLLALAHGRRLRAADDPYVQPELRAIGVSVWISNADRGRTHRIPELGDARAYAGPWAAVMDINILL